MKRFALALDLGSNTLRAVKRDCERGVFVGEYERIVRTADGLAECGCISEAAAKRIIEALNEARKRIGFDDAVVRAVTTEALRRAENGQELLERIFRETGVRFEIIDGEEEARLTLRAVRSRLKALGFKTDSLILVDIGGGSTELVIVRGEELRSRSFPLGIVTLSQESRSLAGVERLLPEKLEPLWEFVAEVQRHGGLPSLLVATAGTPTTVAAMKLGMEYATYDAGRVNGTRLERAELRHWLERLLRMDPKDRQRTVGVGREDLIAAGILIFEGVFRVTGLEECLVIDDGLREGVAIDLCESMK